MALVREQFYWSMVHQDVTNMVKMCKRCKKVKGPYIGPNVKQGSIIANNTMDLLCLDFATPDPSKDGKENILIIYLITCLIILHSGCVLDHFTSYFMCQILQKRIGYGLLDFLSVGWIHLRLISNSFKEHMHTGFHILKEVFFHVLVFKKLFLVLMSKYAGNTNKECYNH